MGEKRISFWQVVSKQCQEEFLDICYYFIALKIVWFLNPQGKEQILKLYLFLCLNPDVPFSAV